VAPWLANVVALTGVAFAICVWSLALLWRVGSWHLSPAATLTFDEGLRIGSQAPQVACRSVEGAEMHLSFDGAVSFVVFGSDGCKPCVALLGAAGRHPATRAMRRVYLTNGGVDDLSSEILSGWEAYVYEDEDAARETWRAPVSPYFYVINEAERVVEKGVGSTSDHLDRLFHLKPGYSPDATIDGRGALVATAGRTYP
jgi:hypothetical protein